MAREIIGNCGIRVHEECRVGAQRDKRPVLSREKGKEKLVSICAAGCFPGVMESQRGKAFLTALLKVCHYMYMCVVPGSASMPDNGFSLSSSRYPS